jgi:Protein of unknown function (DUF2442)
MAKIPVRVVVAEYVAARLIKVRFNDSTEKTVDFSRWLDGEVFQPLREERAFKQFFVAGGTVCWPNGADIAPETLYKAPDAVSARPNSRQKLARRA